MEAKYYLFKQQEMLGLYKVCKQIISNAMVAFSLLKPLDSLSVTVFSYFTWQKAKKEKRVKSILYEHLNITVFWYLGI